MDSRMLSEIESREMLPGFFAKLIHSDRMTIAYWEIREGSEFPEHAHSHEQIVNMLEGSFELCVAGLTEVLEPGSIVVLPPNVPHAGRAITDCRILDVWSPAREDYR